MWDRVSLVFLQPALCYNLEDADRIRISTGQRYVRYTTVYSVCSFLIGTHVYAELTGFRGLAHEPREIQRQ